MIPAQGLDGGERSGDSEVVDQVTRGGGAYIMGRKVFGGGGDVSIAGGASTVRQYVAAGLLDELYLHIVPIVPRAGELLQGVGDPTLEPVKVVASPAVTHVKHRVLR